MSYPKNKQLRNAARSKENSTMNAEFASLILFPNIGMFAVDISVEVRCSKTGMLLLSKQASIPQRIHAI